MAKRGGHFTVMVVGPFVVTFSPRHSSLRSSFTGESGLGKTTLINTLFSTELSPLKDYRRRHVKQLDKLTEVRQSQNMRRHTS